MIVLFAPAVGLATVAVASPPPLRMTVLSVTPSKSSFTKEILVSVTNRSNSVIEPHFALSSSVSMSRFWTVSNGPPSRQTATYDLMPAAPSAGRSLLGPRIVLRAMSAYPETLSSVALPMLSAPGVPR